MSKRMKELVQEGFVRKDDSGHLYPNMWSKVEDELSGYNVEDEVVEDTYQTLLAKISS